MLQASKFSVVSRTGSPVLRVLTKNVYSGGLTSRQTSRSLIAMASQPPSAPKPVPEMYSETDDPELAAFQKIQNSAPRPTPAEQARTLMQQARFGVLSTLSSGDGSPFGSVVEFVADENGKPVLATSTLSAHTSDMIADGRISVTVMSQGFKNLQDARFCLQGTVQQLSAEDKASLREIYLKKYPDAFYVDFGDFKWFRMEDVKGGRLIGGFGAAFKISAEDYMAAKPDPITAFSAPVCGHMNEDHEQDTIAILKHYTGLTVDKARMIDLDRLGINIEISRKGASSKIRLPFIRPADDRKSIKDVIVEMTKTAKAATAQTTSS